MAKITATYKEPSRSVSCVRGCSTGKYPSGERISATTHNILNTKTLQDHMEKRFCMLQQEMATLRLSKSWLSPCTGIQNAHMSLPRPIKSSKPAASKTPAASVPHVSSHHTTFMDCTPDTQACFSRPDKRAQCGSVYCARLYWIHGCSPAERETKARRDCQNSGFHL